MASRFPFPQYPVGWFQVAASTDIAAAQVKPLEVFGQELVLYRTEGGQAVLLDAYCAHMGAHLGHGGRVCGDLLECPFHAWRYGPDGGLREVPYSSSLPRVGQRCWPIQEQNGFVFAFHDPDGAAPTWQPPDLTEFSSPDWTSYGSRTWRIRTHAQEIAENIPDAPHFFYVHASASNPQTLASERDHVFVCNSTMQQKTPRGLVDAGIAAEGHGLGIWRVLFSGIVDTMLLTAPTPVDDDTVSLRVTWAVKDGAAGSQTPVGRSMVEHIAHQIEQDIPIWENKIYRARPPFVPGDGPIRALRKWATQFYPAP